MPHVRAMLLAALAAAAPALAAPHHRPSAHVSHAAPSHAARDALLKARAERAALARQQAAQAQMVQARTRAQALAQARALQAAARAQTLGAVSDADRAVLAQTTQQLDATAARIAVLRADQARTQTAIASNAATLRALLPTALRVSAHPNATLLVASSHPGDVVRGLTILSGVAMLTDRSAGILRDQTAALDRTNTELSAQSAQLAALQDKQAAQARAAAQSATSARWVQRQDDNALARARAAASAAVAQAAALSTTLSQIDAAERAAEAKADAEARAAETAHQAARAHDAQTRAQTLANTLSGHAGPGLASHGGAAPVAGPVLTAFGQTTEAGPATGITYAADPGSAVHAPCSGAVEFAGPFRSFGRMLILDCGRGYRFVIAGMGSLSVASGAQIGRGGPLGVMGSTGGSRPILFVQLRQGAQSVDPAPFL